MRLPRAILPILLWLAGLSAAQGQTYDPCLDLVKINETEQSVTWNILNLFGPRETVERPDGIGDNTYFVSIRAGRYANVSCADETPYEYQDMYLIGQVVRPLYALEPEKFGRAVDGTPILVLTEHGHRKIMPLEHLTPITQNAAYIFADSYANTKICRSEDDCPGNAEDICDDRCRYTISAKFGYAVAGQDNPTFQTARAAQEKLQGDLLIQLNQELTPEEIETAQADICTPFPVRAYKRGGELHQPRPSYLTFCTKRATYGADSDGYTPLKIVDLAYAERVFSYRHNGSFHRSLGDGSEGLRAALDILSSARFTAVKPCGQELVTEGSLNSGIGAQVEIDAGVLTLNAGAGGELAASLTTSFSADDFLLFSTYFIEPFPNGVPEAQSDTAPLWLFRIIFRSHCDGNRPSRSGSMTIHYDRLPGNMVEIEASRRLTESGDIEGGLTGSYTEKWGNQSLIPKCDANFLRLGQFWQIRDHIGYFIWRDVLREYFYGVPGAYDLLADYPLDQQPLVRDFFVHLIMAAAFHHLDPERRHPQSRGISCG